MEIVFYKRGFVLKDPDHIVIKDRRRSSLQFFIPEEMVAELQEMMGTKDYVSVKGMLEHLMTNSDVHSGMYYFPKDENPEIVDDETIDQ